MYKTVDKTIYKQAFNPENMIRCWNECLDKSSFHSRRKEVEEFNKKNYWKKKGIAIVPMKFSVGFAATSYHQVSLIFVERALMSDIFPNYLLVMGVGQSHFPDTVDSSPSQQLAEIYRTLLSSPAICKHLYCNPIENVSVA